MITLKESIPKTKIRIYNSKIYPDLMIGDLISFIPYRKDSGFEQDLGEVINKTFRLSVEILWQSTSEFHVNRFSYSARDISKVLENGEFRVH